MTQAPSTVALKQLEELSLQMEEDETRKRIKRVALLSAPLCLSDKNFTCLTKHPLGKNMMRRFRPLWPMVFYQQ